MKGDGVIRGWPGKTIRRAWKTKDEIHKRNKRLGLHRNHKKVDKSY